MAKLKSATNTKGSKTLLNASIFDQISGVAQTLFKRFMDTQVIHLTGEEFVQAYIRTEHIPTLQKAKELCGDFGSVRHMSHRGYGFTFDWHETAPLPAPNYVSVGLSPDCPPELRARITDQMDARIHFGDLMADFLDSFFVFNHWLTDVRSFGIMLPVLPVLAARVDTDYTRYDMKALVEKMSTGINFRLPMLPEEVKIRLRDASAFVLGMTMLDGDVARKHRRDLQIHGVTLDRAVWNDSVPTRTLLLNPDVGAPRCDKRYGSRQ